MKSLLKLKLVVIVFLGLFSTTLYAQTFNVELDNISINYRIISEINKEIGIERVSSAAGEVVIPSTILHNGENYKVTSILTRAFENDNTITSIEIPNTLIDIEKDAFSYCYKLVEVKISENINEDFYRKGEIGDYAFYYCKSLKSVTLPNNISEIGEGAFYNCNSLTLIELPDSLSVIGNQTFSGCVNLTSIELPDSLSVIGNQTFSGCGLTSIVLPENLTTLGSYAFYGCKFTTINIPKSLTSIVNVTTCFPSDLESIIVEEGNPIYDSRDNCNAIIETATNKLILACKNTKIPTSVKVIGSNAFYSINSTTITIPSTVQSLETNAISGCENVNIVVEDGNDVLSGLSFYTATVAINNLYLGRNIESSSPLIKSSSTHNCYIKNLTIGKYVSKLSIDYLLECSEKLESINVDIENTIYSSPDNCNALISNADRTLLLGCKNTIIPDNVEVIGKHSFQRCKLQNISIPKSVKVIGEWAFCNASLQQIEIPKTVESIEYYAFVGTSLRKIVFYGNPKTNKSFAGSEFVEEVRSYSKAPQECSLTNPDTEIIPGDGPYDVMIFRAKLYVPKGTKALYKSLNEWKKFSNIYEFDATVGIDDVEDTNVVEIARYDITGKLLTHPTKGVNIVKMSDGSIKKVFVK